MERKVRKNPRSRNRKKAQLKLSKEIKITENFQLPLPPQCFKRGSTRFFSLSELVILWSRRMFAGKEIQWQAPQKLSK